MQNILYVDFETRAKPDLAVVGLDNYARQAQAIILGWALNDEPVNIWRPPQEAIPSRLENYLDDPSTLMVCWNAAFERNIFKYALHKDLPISRFRDAMILSRHLSLPGSLDSVCDILKISEDKAKMKNGKKLIQFFCTPAKGQTEGQETLWGVSDGFNDPREFPDEWKKFQEYCIRDVEIERSLWHMLSKLGFPEEQWKDWFMDQEFNEYGVPISVERARKALSLAERYKKESKLQMNAMTGLANAGSVKQLLGWLETQGYKLGSINKIYVDPELKNPESKLTQLAKDVLALRRKSSQSSYTKLKAMLNQVSPDGRLKYQFQFMGASRTGRWSSAGVQIQNLPRPIKEVKKNPERALELLDAEDYATILKEYGGSTLPFVASCLRMLIEAPK